VAVLAATSSEAAFIDDDRPVGRPRWRAGPNDAPG
jgi:hypothetical protein